MSRILLFSIPLVLTACGGAHKGSYAVQAAAESVDTSQSTAEADALWDARADADQLQAALDAYEQIATVDPTNRHALERLVRGYYFLGDGHQTELEQKLASWDTAINWGKRCMGLNSDFTAHLEMGEDEGQAAASFTADDIPCVYWTASALGKWAKASGMGKTLKNVPIVKAWISRVEELSPDYFYTATSRYWGAYFAAIPSFAGQDLDKSKTYLETAITANPGHFGNRLILAEYWALKTQDVATYDEQVAYVLSHCPNELDGLTPEQEAEQRKAERLLASRAEVFLDAGDPPEITTPDCTPVEEVVEEVVEETESEEASETDETGDETDETEEVTEDGATE